MAVIFYRKRYMWLIVWSNIIKEGTKGTSKTTQHTPILTFSSHHPLPYPNYPHFQPPLFHSHFLITRHSVFFLSFSLLPPLSSSLLFFLSSLSSLSSSLPYIQKMVFLKICLNNSVYDRYRCLHFLHISCTTGSINQMKSRWSNVESIHPSVWTISVSTRRWQFGVFIHRRPWRN